MAVPKQSRRQAAQFLQGRPRGSKLTLEELKKELWFIGLDGGTDEEKLDYIEQLRLGVVVYKSFAFDKLLEGIAEGEGEEDIEARIEKFSRENPQKFATKVNSVIEKEKAAGTMSDIAGTPSENANITSYTDASGTLKREDVGDDKFNFNPDATFTGVLKVQRVGNDGELQEDNFDIVVFDKGKPVSIILGDDTKGECRVANMADLLKQMRETGVEVTRGVERTADVAPVLPPSDAPVPSRLPRRRRTRAQQMHIDGVGERIRVAEASAAEARAASEAARVELEATRVALEGVRAAAESDVSEARRATAEARARAIDAEANAAASRAAGEEASRALEELRASASETITLDAAALLSVGSELEAARAVAAQAQEEAREARAEAMYTTAALETRSSELDGARSEVREVSEKAGRTEKALEGTNASLLAAQATITELAARNQEQMRGEMEMGKRLEASNEEKGKLLRQVEALKRDVSAKQKQTNEKEGELKRLAATESKLRAQAAETKREIDELRSKAELSKIEAETLLKAEDKRDRIADSLRRQSSHLGRLKKELAEAQKREEEANTHKEELAKELEAQQIINVGLMSAIIEAATAAEAARRKILSVEDELVAARAASSDAFAHASSAEAMAGEAVVRAAESAKEAGKAKKELEALRSLTAEESGLDAAALLWARSELESAKAEVERARDAAAAASARALDVEASLGAQSEKLAEIREALRSTKDNLGIAERDLAGSEAALKEALAEVSALREEKSRASEQLRKTRGARSRAERRGRDASSDERRALAEIERLSGEFSKARDEAQTRVVELEASLESARAAAAEGSRAASSTISGLEAQLSEAQAQAAGATAQTEATSRRAMVLEEELGRTRLALDALTAHQASGQELNAAQRNELTTLTAKLTTLTAEKTTAEERLRQLSDAISKAHASMQSSQSETDRLKSEARAAEAENKRIVARMGEIEDREKTLQAEILSLRTQLRAKDRVELASKEELLREKLSEQETLQRDKLVLVKRQAEYDIKTKDLRAKLLVSEEGKTRQVLGAEEKRGMSAIQQAFNVSARDAENAQRTRERVQEMQDELREAKLKLADARRELGDKSAQAQEAMAKVSRLTSELEATKAQAADSIRETETRLMQQLADARDAADAGDAAAKAKIAALEAEISTTRSEADAVFETAKKGVVESEARGRDLTSEAEAAERESISLNFQIDAQDKELARLKEDINSKDEQLKELEARAQELEEMKGRSREQEEALAELHTKMAEVSKEKENAQAEAERTKDALNKLKAKIEDVHAILNPTVGLQRKLDAETEHESALKVRMEEMKEAAKHLNIKVAALQRQISDMGEERSKERSAVKLELIRSLAEQESLRRKKIALKQELGVSSMAIEAAKAKLAEAEEARKRKGSKLAEEKRAHEAKVVSDLRAQLERAHLAKEHETSKAHAEEVARLEARIKGVIAEKSAEAVTKAKTAEMEVQTDLTMEDLKEMEDKLKEQEASMKTSAVELERARQEVRALQGGRLLDKSSISALEGRIDVLIRENAAKVVQTREIEASLKSQEADSKAKEKELRASKGKLEKEIDSLKEQLERERKDSLEEARLKEQAEKRVEALKRELSGRPTHEQMEESSRSLTSARDTMYAEIRQRDARIQGYREQETKHREKMAALERQLSDEASMGAELAALRGRNQVLSEATTRLNYNLERAEAELKELKETIEDRLKQQAIALEMRHDAEYLREMKERDIPADPGRRARLEAREAMGYIRARSPSPPTARTTDKRGRPLPPGRRPPTRPLF